MPQAGLFIVVRVKGYFSFLLVNNRVVLFEPVYSKDNRVVSKWCNIGLELFLVPIYVQVELCYIHRQNMVPFQWPQWLVVDAIGAQLRSFGNSTNQPMSCFFDTQPARSLRVTCAQPTRNLPVIYAFGNHNYIYLFYTNNIF